MNAAENAVPKVQRQSRREVRQLLAERVGGPGAPPAHYANHEVMRCLGLGVDQLVVDGGVLSPRGDEAPGEERSVECRVVASPQDTQDIRRGPILWRGVQEEGFEQTKLGRQER